MKIIIEDLGQKGKLSNEGEETLNVISTTYEDTGRRTATYKLEHFRPERSNIERKFGHIFEIGHLRSIVERGRVIILSRFYTNLPIYLARVLLVNTLTKR